MAVHVCLCFLWHVFIPCRKKKNGSRERGEFATLFRSLSLYVYAYTQTYVWMCVCKRAFVTVWTARQTT